MSLRSKTRTSLGAWLNSTEVITFSAITVLQLTGQCIKNLVFSSFQSKFFKIIRLK